MNPYLYFAIGTAIFSFIVYPYFSDVVNYPFTNVWSKSGRIFESLIYGLVFPIYWLFVFFIVIGILISYLCEYIDNNGK